MSVELPNLTVYKKTPNIACNMKVMIQASRRKTSRAPLSRGLLVRGRDRRLRHLRLRLLAHAGAPESPRAPLRVRQLLHLHRRDHADLLEDQLGHAIAHLHDEVLPSEVEEDDADVAAVVGIDDAGAAVDHLLHRETAAEGSAADRGGGARKTRRVP